MSDRVAEVEFMQTAAPAIEPRRVGYRLERFEVFNWGTFDGTVHSLTLDGQLALLVGQNGAGKSTLVDALLTLLVRPGRTRNYNLAAGANKTERSEKSYILGAFDRRSQEDTNRGEVRYLRSAGTGSTPYSVLLACFRNYATGRVFTVAQVLFLRDDGVEKVYCFAEDDRTIARDCAQLKGMDRLVQELKRRKFQATKSYAEFFEWFRKATGIKEQAMDIFNQTVAVKDIHRLNDFIRKHMLDARPWTEKVDELFRHFKDLSDAHRELERVRGQRDLLDPIEKYGLEFRRQGEALRRVQQLLAAADAYFAQKTIEILAPEIVIWQNRFNEVQDEQARLQQEIERAQEQCRQLTNELEQAGGERMRLIPQLIRQHELEAAAKRKSASRLHDALRKSGITEQVSDDEGFQLLRAKLPQLIKQGEVDLLHADGERTRLIESRVEPVRVLRETEAELQVLMRRQGNLPSEYVEMRRRLCEELRLAERDLPFAAELIAVRSEERAWEGSIEMVLRGFALSLLVPQRNYPLVSRYLDRTPLRDARGHGQKLVYLQVGERERQNDGPAPAANSLFWKLDFREGWSRLLPWVKLELQQRFNFRCCETIEEFQQSPDRALTYNRHTKLNATRHEKDDRDRVTDPRYYVLGWDNREKKQRLAEAITTLKKEIDQLDACILRQEAVSNQLRQRLVAAAEVNSFQGFAEIDYALHEREIAELQLELKAFEEQSDTVRYLRQRLKETEQQVAGMGRQRDDAVRREQMLDTEIKRGQHIVAANQQILSQGETDGSLLSHQSHFAEIDRLVASDPLTLENFPSRPESFRREQQRIEQTLRDQIKPLEESVMRAMSKFLSAHPDERMDLDVALDFLPDFLRLLERIRAEDLPRFESRFKERLNEKVGQEIGVLRGNLNTERTEIEDRIDLLNRSLRQVPFGPGSHMRLVAKPVRDPEVARFRHDLDACVSGQFEGTLQADEARFKQIESLINRLRDEERWRIKVTDVRNWFDFAAVETDDATGAELSFHDDSAGQSGGEKAKLAFTILMAAIAFQYDLDPLHPATNRFHFVVVDEMFSRVDDGNATYALELFRRFGLQLLIVAPLDAKARVTEDHVGCYLLVQKDDVTNRSQVLRMTASEFQQQLPEEEDVAAYPGK
jgi:uncharacterized protein YPO0396